MSKAIHINAEPIGESTLERARAFRRNRLRPSVKLLWAALPAPCGCEEPTMRGGVAYSCSHGTTRTFTTEQVRAADYALDRWGAHHTHADYYRETGNYVVRVHGHGATCGAAHGYEVADAEGVEALPGRCHRMMAHIGPHTDRDGRKWPNPEAGIAAEAWARATQRNPFVVGVDPGKRVKLETLAYSIDAKRFTITAEEMNRHIEHVNARIAGLFGVPRNAIRPEYDSHQAQALSYALYAMPKPPDFTGLRNFMAGCTAAGKAAHLWRLLPDVDHGSWSGAVHAHRTSTERAWPEAAAAVRAEWSCRVSEQVAALELTTPWDPYGDD